MSTEKPVMFDTKVLRKMYALPDRKSEAFNAHIEILPLKPPNRVSSQDNVTTLQNKAADTEIGNQEQNGVDDMKKDIAENLNIEQRRGAGHVMPKKKRSWQKALSKMFTSCFHVKNDAD